MALQIFLSYARDDDRLPPDSKAKKGFVSHLHGLIVHEFSQRGQPRPRLWRDAVHIEHGDDFDKHIRQNLVASDILLIVLSCNWLASEWCQRELDVFVERWKEEGSDRVRKRILFITKHFVPRDIIPPLLINKEAFEFFHMDEEESAGS